MNLFSNFSSYSYVELIPLYTPAVKKDKCEVDLNLLANRTLLVTAVALVAIATCAFLTPTYAMAPVVIVATQISIFVLDYFKANNAANEKAVNEYLNLPIPSESATTRITSNFKAAKMFVDKKADFSKEDKRTNTVLDFFYTHDFNIFKLFIDSGANLFGLNQYGTSHFKRILGDENPVFLDYVLKTNKVKSSDFNENQQTELWRSIKNVKSGKLLVEHGFNINSRDNKGFTPLMQAVPGNFSMNWFPEEIARMRKEVKILLDCGADKTLTVNLNGKQCTARDLCNDPETALLFDQY